jgi:hypothetical protein
MTTLVPRPPAGPPATVQLRPGQEWWEDNPHRLAARLRSDRTIQELARYQLTPRLYGAVVVRLKPRRSRAQSVALYGVWTLIALTAVGVGGYFLLKALSALVAAAFPIVAVLAGLWGLTKILTGHRPTCVGLHCAGCRG